MIRFGCPGCKTVLEVDNARAGSVAACSKCGAKVARAGNSRETCAYPGVSRKRQAPTAAIFTTTTRPGPGYWPRRKGPTRSAGSAVIASSRSSAWAAWASSSRPRILTSNDSWPSRPCCPDAWRLAVEGALQARGPGGGGSQAPSRRHDPPRRRGPRRSLPGDGVSGRRTARPEAGAKPGRPWRKPCASAGKSPRAWPRPMIVA